MPDILLYTITLGFISGTTASTNISLGILVGVFLFLGIIYFGFVRNISLKKSLITLLIFISAFGFGVVRYQLSIVTPPQNLIDSVGKEIQIEGRIVDDPDISDGKTTTVLKIGDVGIRTTVKTEFKLSYNDTVSVSGILRKPENFLTDSGSVFDYVSYLAKDDVFFVISNAKLVHRKVDIEQSFTRALFNIRHKIEEKLSEYIPSRESGFVSGVLLGTKTSIEPKLRDALVATGTIHLVSLSGYNVSVVADGVSSILKNFLPQIFASLIGGVGIILFVIMTGASSTAIRAGLMALLLLLARVVGRPVVAIRVLAFAALILVAVNPKYLIYDVSFQLSFLATLGLLLISPVYTKWFNKFLPKYLSELISSTLAAITAVTPLLIYKMGIFSFISLPINILILPFIPVLMFMGFIAVLICLIFPVLNIVVSYPLYLFAKGIIEAITFASRIPFATVTFQQIPLIIVIFIYLSLGVIFVHFNLTESEK